MGRCDLGVPVLTSLVMGLRIQREGTLDGETPMIGHDPRMTTRAPQLDPLGSNSEPEYHVRYMRIHYQRDQQALATWTRCSCAKVVMNFNI